jgi:hypothetical protein
MYVRAFLKKTCSLFEIEPQGSSPKEGLMPRVDDNATPTSGEENNHQTQGIHWEPKQRRLRDLILLFLSEHDGGIEHPRGWVSTLIRERFGLPESERSGLNAAIRLMLQAGLIWVRRTPSGALEAAPTTEADERSKLTYGLMLQLDVEPAELERIRAELPDILMELGIGEAEPASNAIPAPKAGPATTILPGSPTQGPDYERLLDRLHVDVALAYDLLVSYASLATRKRDGNEVALKMRHVLKADGFSLERAEEMLHYLGRDCLAFVVCKGRVGDSEDRYLYWWMVQPNRTIKREALDKIIKSGRVHQPRRRRAGDVRPPTERRREQAHAQGVPDKLGADQAGPVTVRQTAITGSPAVSVDTPATTAVSPDGTAALATELAGLLQTLRERDAQRAEALADANARADKAEAELAALRDSGLFEEIQKLRDQLA